MSIYSNKMICWWWCTGKVCQDNQAKIRLRIDTRKNHSLQPIPLMTLILKKSVFYCKSIAFVKALPQGIKLSW